METKCIKDTGCERIYDFLVDYIKENGYPPSMREICSGIYLSSTSSVHALLWKLELMGKIVVTPGVPRGIKLMDYQFVKMEE